MRRTAHGADIGPGIGFGQGKGGDGSPGRHPRQVVPLLLLRPVQRDGTAAQALHGEGEIGQAGMPRQGFTDQADAARVDGLGTAAPGLAAHRITDPVRGAQLAHQRDAGRIGFGSPRMRRVVDVFVRPAIEGQRQFLVVPFEEGPVEIGRIGQDSVPLEHRLLLGHEGVVGAMEVVGRHADRLGLGLGSMAWSTSMLHSCCSIFLVMPWAKVGPPASSCGPASALPAPGQSGSHRRLKNPQRSPSSPPMARPVISSSVARPWPMMRGSMAQAPMSQPARPTRVNRKAVFERAVPRRRSEPAPGCAGTGADAVDRRPSTGCGQARMALITSPVMRVKASRPACPASSAGR
jgi:hypothetical protein